MSTAAGPAGPERFGRPADDPEAGSRVDRRRRRLAREIASYQDPVVRRRNTILLVIAFTFVVVFFVAVATIGG